MTTRQVLLQNQTPSPVRAPTAVPNEPNAVIGVTYMSSTRLYAVSGRTERRE
jgi:hypothetical protein